RRYGALHAGALGGGDGAAPARGVQAGAATADERGVLHRTAAARPAPGRAAVHADLCDEPGQRLDRPRLRAAADEPHHPSAVGIRGAAQPAVGAARGARVTAPRPTLGWSLRATFCR